MPEITVNDAGLYYEEPTDIQSRGKIRIERDGKKIILQVIILRGQRSSVVVVLSEDKAKKVCDVLTHELEAKEEEH